MQMFKLKCLFITEDVRTYDDISKIIDGAGFSVERITVSKTDAEISTKLKRADVVFCDLDTAMISLQLHVAMILKKRICCVFSHTKIDAIPEYIKHKTTVVNFDSEGYNRRALTEYLKRTKFLVRTRKIGFLLLISLPISLFVYIMTDCTWNGGKRIAEDGCCQTQEDIGPGGQETKYFLCASCYWPPTFVIKFLRWTKTYNERGYRRDDWRPDPY